MNPFLDSRKSSRCCLAAGGSRTSWTRRWHFIASRRRAIDHRGGKTFELGDNVGRR